MADVKVHYSNLAEAGPTTDFYSKLAIPGNRKAGLSKPASRRPQELSKRLGRVKVAKLVERAEAGESVNKLAKEQGVAVSALARMLKAQGVEIQKQGLTDAQRAQLVEGYEAGATMAELEARYSLSHSTVYRALHRAGVNTRASAPRPSRI